MALVTIIKGRKVVHYEENVATSLKKYNKTRTQNGCIVIDLEIPPSSDYGKEIMGITFPLFIPYKNSIVTRQFKKYLHPTQYVSVEVRTDGRRILVDFEDYKLVIYPLFY